MSSLDKSGYVDQARQRARQKKSAWNLLAVPFCILGVGGAWIGIAFFFETYRRHLFPSDCFLASGTRLGNVLMFVAPLFPSLPIGMIVGNFLLWLIPPAKAALEREVLASRSPSFRSTQVALAKFGAVLAAVALPLCLLGANSLWAIAPSRLDYRPMFASVTRQYDWSDVARIEAGCSSGKSVTYNFVVVLTDQTKIDLMEESPRDFAAVYPRVQAALRGRAYGFSNRNFVGSCAGYAPQRWREILSHRPTN